MSLVWRRDNNDTANYKRPRVTGGLGLSQVNQVVGFWVQERGDMRGNGRLRVYLYVDMDVISFSLLGYLGRKLNVVTALVLGAIFVHYRFALLQKEPDGKSNSG